MPTQNLLDGIPTELCYDIVSYLKAYDALRQLSLASWRFELVINEYVGIISICHKPPDFEKRFCAGKDRLRRSRYSKSVVNEHYRRVSPNVFTIFIEEFCAKDISTRSNLAVFKTLCERYPYVEIEYHKYQDLYISRVVPCYDYDMFCIDTILVHISGGLHLAKHRAEYKTAFHINCFESMESSFPGFQYNYHTDAWNVTKYGSDLIIPNRFNDYNVREDNERKFDMKKCTKVTSNDTLKQRFISTLLDLYPNPSFLYDFRSKEMEFNSRPAYHTINFVNSEIKSQGRNHMPQHGNWKSFKLNGSHVNLVSVNLTFINTIRKNDSKCSILGSLWNKTRNKKTLKRFEKLIMNKKKLNMDNSSLLEKPFFKFDQYIEQVSQTLERNVLERNTQREIDFIKFRAKRDGFNCWKEMFNFELSNIKKSEEGVNNLQWITYMHRIFIDELAKTMNIYEYLRKILWQQWLGRPVELNDDPLANDEIYERKDIEELYDSIFLPLFSKETEDTNSDLHDNVKFIKFNVAYNHHQLRKNATYDLEMHKRTLNELLKLN
ncbi:hypothetical protein WICMUC_003510 [Wickerhamomyces mucosus]|uniref:F-box domain-containing protein n=1 Tax=Wickerhamomyces mucosus TaxID=1378264 RepID=A0A9P8PLZ3_9ASCO|nr:hypothetical protein WICMUC_003510 [Wickerhamomyces mucosus]